MTTPASSPAPMPGAQALAGRIVRDIAALPVQQWDALSQNPFYSWEYMKALSDHAAGALEPRHIALESEDGLAAVAPAFVQRSPHYFSLRELLRGRFPPIFRKPCLAIHAPLSFSSLVPSRLPLHGTLRAVDAVLAAQARRQGIGIGGYLYVEKDSKQASILKALGYHPVFVTCTSRLDLSPGTFESYLNTLPRQTRNIRTNIRKELRQFREFGGTLRLLNPKAADWPALIALYNQVYAKYNRRPCSLSPKLLAGLVAAFGDRALLMAAERDGRLLGYGILVREGGLWHCFNMGLDQSQSRHSASYFVLAYDYPIMLALEQGAQALNLRPGHAYLKSLRGARLIPLYMYVKHFGSGWENRALGSYCRALDTWYRRKFWQGEVAPHQNFAPAL